MSFWDGQTNALPRLAVSISRPSVPKSHLRSLARFDRVTNIMHNKAKPSFLTSSRPEASLNHRLEDLGRSTPVGLNACRTSLRSQRGLTLLEVIVSLSIFALSVIGIVQMTDKATGDIKNTVVAEQLRKHGDAARSYIKDNYATVAAAATPTQPFLITTSMLVSGGYLATGTPATNGFGQSTCTLVLEPTLGKLQGLVVTEGGTTLDDLTLGDIAALVGGSGGAVRTAPAGAITGAQGGWSIPVATYSNLPNQLSQKCDGTGGNVQLTAGHPAMALWFENGFAQSSVLYRDAVPGMPELNTVNTPIVFNSVQTTGTACSTNASVAADSTGAVLSCQGGIWKTQGSAFWQDTVPNYASLPVCNSALNGSTRVVMASTVGGTPRAHTCNGTAWQALAVDDSGNLNLQGILSAGKVQLSDVVVAGAACSTTGQVSRDASGLILSCQSGSWKGSGTNGDGGGYHLVYDSGWNVWGALSMVNPKTGSFSCPSGYTAVGGYTGTGYGYGGGGSNNYHYLCSKN